MSIKFTHTNESITLIINGNIKTVLAGTIQYNQVAEAILQGNLDAIPGLLTTGGALQQYLGQDFTVIGTTVVYKGRELPPRLSGRIHDLAVQGESPAPLLRFFERLAKNPSFRSVNQLFNFLENANIPIETDGTFLTYKKVRSDLKDVYTGTIDNTPGVTIKMDRNLISDDPEQTCHYGLHVGALGYMGHFGGTTILICRVDPEHVVCVPNDYNAMKMRVCEYFVVGIYADQPMPSGIVDSSYTDEDDLGDDYIYDDEDDLDDDYQIVKTPAPLENEEEPPAPKQKLQFRGFKTMDAAGLMKQSIEDLRKFASSRLKLVGASKIPGGKTALVAKILKFRKKV